MLLSVVLVSVNKTLVSLATSVLHCGKMHGFQKRQMEDIFHLAISGNHTPTSKLAAYFQIAPCDLVSLLLLHQCSPLPFWYLYFGSHHLEACVKLSLGIPRT